MPLTDEPLRRTPLYDVHVGLGARMIEFGGWLMPVEYTGVLAEHRAVRGQAGLFDLSHMGELRVVGAGAGSFLEWALTNDVGGLAPGQARYSPVCLPDGGIVDDVVLYRRASDYLLVVNAANIDKDRRWLEALRQGAAGRPPAAAGDVRIEDESDRTALLAVQGPAAEGIVAALADVDVAQIPFYAGQEGRVAGIPAWISRTGYTGEDGFELYVDAAAARPLWEALLAAGGPKGLVPVGLGARDTLRLEVRYLLYGNDIDERTTPLEAGLAWAVKFDKGDFVGRDALWAQKEQGVSRRLVGLRMAERGVPRHGYPLLAQRGGGLEQVGAVTSGSFSPTLAEYIGMGYVPTALARPGGDIAVEIRGRALRAEIVKGRFVQPRTRQAE